jgi:hypothetical protein
MALLLVPWTFDATRILLQGIATATTPVATCLTEMHIVHGIQQVSEGDELYPAIDGLPLTFHYYNPLTYLPTGLIGGWLDLDFDALLIASRILPLLASLGIAALLGFYVWRQSGDRVLVALSCLMLFFFHSAALTDFFRNRPETPGSMLTLAGWIVVQLRPRHWPAVAALLFVTAIGFKQTFLAAPIACGIHLMWSRDWRDLTRLVSACVVGGLVMISASYFWLGDGYFQHTVLAMKSNPIDIVAGAKLFLPILMHNHWQMLLPAAVVSVAGLLAIRKERPLLLYLAVTLLLTAIAQGKVGADLNYFIELSTVMVLTIATAIAHLFAARRTLAYAPIALLLIGTWLPIFQFGPTWNNVSHYRDARAIAYAGPPTSQAAHYAERYKIHRGTALIADDQIAVRVGDPVALDWYALQYFFATDHIGFDRIDAAIANRDFSLIVLRKDPVAVGRDGKPAFDWQKRIEKAALAAGYRANRDDPLLIEFTQG